MAKKRIRAVLFEFAGGLYTYSDIEMVPITGPNEDVVEFLDFQLGMEENSYSVAYGDKLQYTADILSKIKGVQVLQIIDEGGEEKDVDKYGMPVVY